VKKKKARQTTHQTRSSLQLTHKRHLAYSQAHMGHKNYFTVGRSGHTSGTQEAIARREWLGASFTLLWAGTVVRIPKSRLPTKRLVLSWVQEPRLSGCQEMNFGRSLSRHLQHFGLSLAFTEWVTTAQDRTKWKAILAAAQGRHQKTSAWQ
jgi:hypothetical protein